MSWTLCTSGSAIAKAGAYCNSNIISYDATYKPILDTWSDEVEGLVCDVARVSLSGSYASLNAAGKQVLGTLTSSWIAQKIINYDMGGFTSLGEATTMLNVLENDIKRCIDLVKDDKIKTYLGAT